MWVDLFLFIVIAIIPIMMAIIGAILAPVPKKYKYLFGIMGVIYTILVSVQGFRIYESTIQAKERDQEIAELTEQQLKVQEKQFALNYDLAAIVHYRNNRLNIDNQGKTNLFLWGVNVGESKLGESEKKVFGEHRVIAPNGSHFLEFDETFLEEDRVIDIIGQNGQLFIPIDIFVKNALQKEHIIKSRLHLVVQKGQLKVNTQMLEIVQAIWSK